MSKHNKALILILIAVVCGAVAAVHWPALEAKAISFDDQQYLIDNPLVQNPGWKSAKQFLVEVLSPSTVKGYYQPLTMISLMVDYASGGRENNLRPFHVTSLSLHIANTALIIILLYMLFGNIWAAAATGLLFGVHPMTVEPIPWVGERKTLLAAFFALWSLILYVRYSRSDSWKSYAGCFLMYLLALMSKPTSVPLPVVMLLMDYWPLKKLKAKSVLEKAPLFILGIVFSVITYVSQSQTAATALLIKIGPKKHLLVLCHNIIFYLYKILVPIGLSSHYPIPNPLSVSEPMILAGVVGTCILIPLLLISLRWTQAALVGWLIFFVAIFPTMGVVGFTNVIASDKYAYLPAVGLLMIVTPFLIRVGRSNGTRFVAATVVLILAAGEAVATQRYLTQWQDTITLYKHMLSVAPDSVRVYNNLGVVYAKLGRYDEAIESFNGALKARPDDTFAMYNLGLVYSRQSRWAQAAQAFEQTIKINPDDARAYFRLGVAYLNMGRRDLALKQYEILQKLEPQLANQLRGFIK